MVLISLLPMVASAFSLLTVAMGPVGLIILGITAAIVAGFVVWRNWDTIVREVGNTFNFVFNGIRNVVTGTIETILSWIDALTGRISSLMGRLNDLTNFRMPSFDIPGFDIPNPFSRRSTSSGGFSTYRRNGRTFVDLPGLAEGGTMMRSGMALVGERGPEVVALPGGARVSPLGKGMGGITVNITGNTIFGELDLQNLVVRAVRDAALGGGLSDVLVTR